MEQNNEGIVNSFKNRHLIKKMRRIEELKLEITIAELENKLRITKNTEKDTI